MAEFGYDVFTLAELQLQLLHTDATSALRSIIFPGIATAVAALLTLSCLPVMLFAVAAVIEHYGAVPHWASLLIVAASGMLAGVVISLLCVILIRNRLGVLSRSRDEFVRNIRWVKAVLKTGGGASRAARGSVKPR